MRDWNKCYYEDCLPAMKAFPNDYFDLCVTDPPWKASKTNWKIEGERQTYHQVNYANYPAQWHLEWIQEARRISRIVIFCVPLKDFNEWVKLTSPRGIIIGYFLNGFRPSKVSFINAYSPYFCFFEGKLKRKPVRNIFEIHMDAGFQKKIEYIHESPKTIDMFKYLIEGFDAMTILDPFLGSGAVAEACESLGNRKWIGFEINQKYSPDVEMRIKNGKKAYYNARNKQKALF